MKLADLIVTEQVLNGVAVPNKHSLLHELSKRAGETLRLDPQKVFDAIVARETLGSTGVGMGTAIPHARLAEVRTPYVLFARLSRGIDFESIDGAPVDVVFFILLPLNSDRENLALLAEVSRRLRSPEFRPKIRAASSQTELCRMLKGS
jgi:PTS system nitrogen regulatory IIA component